MYQYILTIYTIVHPQKPTPTQITQPLSMVHPGRFGLLRRFLRVNKIPDSLGQRVTRFLHFTYHERSANSEDPLVPVRGFPLGLVIRNVVKPFINLHKPLLRIVDYWQLLGLPRTLFFKGLLCPFFTWRLPTWPLFDLDRYRTQ